MEFVLGAFLVLTFLVVLSAILWWRFAPSNNLPNETAAFLQPPAAPASEAAPPTISDRVSPAVAPTLSSFAGANRTSVRTKTVVSKHSLKLEREGNRTLYWYDGAPYATVEDIPDAAARAQAEELLPKIEQAEADLMKGPAKARITVNGVSYNSLSEISDPAIRGLVEEGLKQAGKA